MNNREAIALWSVVAHVAKMAARYAPSAEVSNAYELVTEHTEAELFRHTVAAGGARPPSAPRAKRP